MAGDHEEGIVDDKSLCDGAEYFFWRQTTFFDLFSKAKKPVSAIQLEISGIKSRGRGAAAASRKWRPEGAPTTYELLPR